MSSAKWQRHSTFLSVRGRTWIGRALMASPAFLANEGVRWLASGNGSSGGASTGRPVVAPQGKKAGFQPQHGDVRSATTPRTAVADADRDPCEVLVVGGRRSGVSAPGASA